MTMNQLEATRSFWNRFPCDANENYNTRAKFRYSKEPWLLDVIQHTAENYTTVLEIGCGQGTDAITFCKLLKPGSKYIGLDYSQESLKSAEKSFQEVKGTLQVLPLLKVGNAEALPIETGSIPCIYSMGVIHHTPDTQKAIDEIYRALAPGGVAIIIIYRTLSPKLLIAHFLRWLQKWIDRALGTNQFFLKLISKLPLQRLLGTALQECFGVPILKSYRKSEVLKMFLQYQLEEVKPIGMGLPPIGINRWIDRKPSLLGYFWCIRARKAQNP